ncbi:MAG TPA: diguanylate cyclase [Paenibacillus sp.]
MISTLFVNVCIIVTCLYFSGMLSNNHVIGVSSPTLKVKYTSGLLFGLFGIILMYYSIPVAANTYVDLRHLFIVIIAIYMGGTPAVISSIVIGVGRILLYGLTFTSILSFIGFIVIGFVCSYITRMNRSRLFKLNLMNLLSLLIILCILYLCLYDIDLILTFYPIQFVIAIIGGLLAFLITEHIHSSNELLMKLEKRAYTDHLTQLNNLRQFEYSLKNTLSLAKQRGEKLSLLSIDIDHFKSINDTFGHSAGDAVLKQMGQVLLEYSRSFDIVSRNGGEEFTILLLDCPHSHALVIGERIRSSVQSHTFITPDHDILPITISIGVSTYPDTVPDSSGASLVEQADKALYKAKHEGRNRVCSLHSDANK